MEDREKQAQKTGKKVQNRDTKSREPKKKKKEKHDWKSEYIPSDTE